VIGLAGVLWLVGGNSSANSFSGFSNWVPDGSNWTFFGLVVLALLGIEVPLNMGVEIVHVRAIKKYLFWACWCVSMVLLFADIFLVKRAFPEKFEEVRVSSTRLLFLSGIVGVGGRLWLAIVALVSVAAAIVIYGICELTHRREAPTPTPTPVG
jgi:hypothetical protein